MTDAATFRDLARRAREASGPDRELDADVAWALFGKPADIEEAVRRELMDDAWSAAFSASLDAVIRDVVPAEWVWRISSNSAASMCPAEEQHDNWPITALCETPPLALLAAALLARAALVAAAPQEFPR